LIGTPVSDVSTDIATNLTAITSVQNNTRFTSAIPEQMQKPDSSSTAFRWAANLYDTDGNMEDPVNSEILVRVLQADGTPITANMYKEQALSNLLDNATDQANFPSGSGWRALERLGVGQYDLFYKVASTETEEALTVEFGWDEASVIMSQYRSTEVVDYAGDIEDIQAKVNANYVKLDSATPSPTIPAQITTHDTDIKADISTHDTDIKSDIATHDTDIKALPNVEGTPEFLVVPSGNTRIDQEGGIDAVVTTIPVNDVSALQTEGVIIFGTEYIPYTGTSVDNELTGCTRGAYGSTPAVHADNAQGYEVTVYPIRLMVHDNELNMVAPDSAPTIEIVDWNGNQELAPTAMTLISTGLYGYNYLVAATDTPEPKTIRFSTTINTITTPKHSTLMLLDKPASQVDLIQAVGGGTGEFVVTQNGYYDSSNIFHAWTDVTQIPPGQVVCDVNGNYEMRLDAGTYTFKFHKDQYRFPTDEVERTVTS
jgi:hypothetical protein